MATLFFCCWGKSNSVEAEDKLVTADVKTPTDSGLGTDNAASNGGNSAETGPALKSPVEIVVDPSELGDFSAVSRETEILRSYRKPPPPKNRARQSRAPRALFKSSTENLDIFAEVSEDNLNLSLGYATTDASDTSDSQIEQGDTARHSDSSLLLRPRLADDQAEGEGPKREDVRSSMLADIEQTLAAMHSDTKADDEACVQTKANPVSSQPSVPQHTTQSSAGAQSPLLQSKVGPPVSPKPTTRKIIQTSRVDSEENIDKTNNTQYKKLILTESAPEPSSTSSEVTLPDSTCSTDKEQDSTTNNASPETSADGPQQEQEKSSAEAVVEPNQSEQQVSNTSRETESSQPSTDKRQVDNPEETTSEERQSDKPSKEPSSTHDEADGQQEEQDSTSAEATAEIKTENGIDQLEEESQQKGVRQNSVEDQTGKGKTSRIPVRAGSKPRSSPPKSEKQDEGNN